MANEANPALGSPKLFPGLQDVKTESPSLPKTVSGQLSEESKNVFTELFGNDASQKNGSMMNTVVAQTEKKGISYFGAKPKTPELTLKSFSKHSVKPGSAVLKAAVIVLFLTAFGFGTQTRTELSLFGENPALRLENVAADVSELNAEVLVQKNLAAALLLDQFSSAADEYLFAQAQVVSEYTSANNREKYEASAATLKSSIVSLLAQIQEELRDEITPEESAEAIRVAENLITQLQTSSADTQSLLQEQADLNTTKALLSNTTFRSQVTALDLETLSDANIQSLFESFSAMNASLDAIINSIQSSRVLWSVYLDEIESLTKRVDPLFNTEFQSSLSLTDISFKEDGTISISGSTTTEDSKNFTLVSNLIDEYEASPYFENVQERSFAKTNGVDSYTSSFRISMTLQANPDSNE